MNSEVNSDPIQEYDTFRMLLRHIITLIFPISYSIFTKYKESLLPSFKCTWALLHKVALDVQNFVVFRYFAESTINLQHLVFLLFQGINSLFIYWCTFELIKFVFKERRLALYNNHTFMQTLYLIFSIIHKLILSLLFSLNLRISIPLRSRSIMNAYLSLISCEDFQKRL